MHGVATWRETMSKKEAVSKSCQSPGTEESTIFLTREPMYHREPGGLKQTKLCLLYMGITTCHEPLYAVHRSLSAFYCDGSWLGVRAVPTSTTNTRRMRA